MSDSEWTILECPQCQSKRAGITRDSPPRARCSDCGHVYDIATLPPEETKPDKKKRIAEPGKRHRTDNGPDVLEVQEAPPLGPADLGPITHDLGLIRGGGTDALLAAHREANRLSAKFGEEFQAQWLLVTDFLKQLRLTNRARARYAMRWRPRYLAALALSRSPIIAGRMAPVAYNTVRDHRTRDPEFNQQCEAAEEHATQLLHDACFASALEGDCEPVFWQGIRVGHIRKFDSRLRIEMLRAHLPTKFRTPGQHAAATPLGAGQAMLIADADTIASLVSARQAALHEMSEKRALAHVV